MEVVPQMKVLQMQNKETEYNNYNEQDMAATQNAYSKQIWELGCRNWLTDLGKCPHDDDSLASTVTDIRQNIFAIS